MRDRVPCPVTELSSFKSHHWHLLTGALGEALLAVSGVAEPQLQALTRLLRCCGYMRHKIENPLLRPMRREFVAKTIAMCESRLPLYLCTCVRHQMQHFYDTGGWAESIATGPILQK